MANATVTGLPIQRKAIKIGIRQLVVVLLVLGAVFRFSYLDHKVFWGDETSTLTRVAGYTFVEIGERFSDSYTTELAELERYQTLNPERDWRDVISGLQQEEPQLPPVYYLSLRLWAAQFGTSVTALRTFSALISLLAFPCMFWLCRELFDQTSPAWVATALIAVSPFHLVYAQEARSQSLWTITILLSSAALLRAVRVNKKHAWALYGFTLVLSFYTYLLSGLVAIGHGIYILTLEKFRPNQTVRRYLLTAVPSGLLTLPWILTAFGNRAELDGGTAWVKLPVPLISLVKVWLLNISRLFVDFDYDFTTRHGIFYLLILGTTVLVGYALYFLCRHTERRVWLFVVLLTSITVLTLALPDLLLGGRRSGIARYLIPSFLGLEIAVAYLLAEGTLVARRRLWSQQLRDLSLAMVLMLGIVSCTSYLQAPIWWNKSNGVPLAAVSETLTQSAQPVLISSGYPPLELFHLIQRTDFTLQSPDAPIPDDATGVFVMSRNFSDAFLYEVLKYHPDYTVASRSTWKGNIDPTYEYKTELWQLVKQTAAS